MKYLFNSLCVFSLCITAVSCGNDDFPERSKLGGLRVLSISADTPEINASTTVTLSPVISFVDGGNTTLNYTWEACPDPGLDFGADVNCDSSAIALKQTGSGTFNTSALSGSFFTGVATSISVPVSAGVFTYFSSLDSDLQFNGIDYIVVIKYKDQSSEAKIEVLKRIRLTSKTSGLNINPSFGSITFNNSALLAYPTAEGDITISSPSAAETYSRITNVGLKSFSEEMYISWYSSSGEYLFNRTDVGEDNTFTPEGSTGVFVAVYRDGRGGVYSQVVSF
jgi:hypothetical protein